MMTLSALLSALGYVPNSFFNMIKKLNIVAAWALLLSCHLSAAEMNIIFFITDDESPTLGCYGDQIAVTPHVDTLAQDGTVFLNAFATTASCSASRSVVMSGVHNHKNGQYGHMHSYHHFSSFRDVISLSLPRVLAAENYRTVHIGKYHVSPREVFQFDIWLEGNPRSTVHMAEACREVIAAKDERPFFLYFGTTDPHRGGGTDRSFPGELKPDLFGNKRDKGSYPGVREVFYDMDKVLIPPFLNDTPETRSELAQYYQSVSRIDQGLGRLIEILKDADLYDKTLIVFTSDHGMAFAGGKTTVYDGGLRVPFVVRNPYEKVRGVRSTAMISHVDITPSLLDFAGGLDHETNSPKKWKNPNTYRKDKDYAQGENRNGGHLFKQYQGRSWISILSQEDAEDWGAIFASHTFHEIQMYYPMRAIRDRRYKLIWNIAHGQPYPFASDLWAASSWQAQFRKGLDAPCGEKTVGEFINRPAYELYDLQKDPGEGDNLAMKPEYADLLNSYKQKLRKYQEELDDPWIIKWRYE
jgi:N-sulfoglucosamine sulfohydrolase